MVVCNCFNVRESDIRLMADRGPCCLKSVCRETGLGTNCGKCIPHARAVLNAGADDVVLTRIDRSAVPQIRL
ncbi:MAG: bacterioferritin-associated ferredoxin [Lautropia sp.]